MNRKIIFSLLFFILVSNFALAQIKPEKDPHRGTPLIVAYLDSGLLANYPFTEMEKRGAAKRLTHIMYAFVNIADGHPVIADEQTAYLRKYSSRESVDGKADDTSGQSALGGAFNQLRKLKSRYPDLKVLASIGGESATNAKGFSLVSRTAESRRRFVDECVDLFIRGHLPHGISAAGVFDGIDIDWEYPTDCPEGCVPEDKANFTLLLQEFRQRLDEQAGKDGMHYELTMAGSPWVDDYEKYEWQKIHPLLDFINVMTYGLAPPGKTRPNSPLYQSSTETGRWSATFNTDYAVTRYLKEGVPAEKIVMGVPFYGLGWAGVPDVNNGLFQKPAKTESGSWRGISEQYRNLRNLKGFHLFRDPEMQALWIFNRKTGVFWSFDDPHSLSVKMDYVKQKGLGGVMLWELSGDDKNGSLLKAIYRGLRP
jgi:chitinase